MTVTMYGWLLFCAIAVGVLAWWLGREDADKARAQAEWCYDITRDGFEAARAVRVGKPCECALTGRGLDATYCNECGRDAEARYQADWVALDEMYEAYLDDAEDAAQEAFERRLRAKSNTQSEL